MLEMNGTEQYLIDTLLNVAKLLRNVGKFTPPSRKV